MKTVGRRANTEISFHATVKNLKKGCEFNDSVNKFFRAELRIPKGVYHYKTHEDASRHWTDCVVGGIVARQKDKK
ncbi:MAG: hypothetical protein CVU77_02065 [Elusimicrobia bacterium HGW-Elusimicrobia-1]|jgi:hypothetical protein|nr:MAG: hypothetical protein CVU77_02065 [Elusimicrobia bacterium HGW-Elusimicrobia-1]